MNEVCVQSLYVCIIISLSLFDLTFFTYFLHYIFASILKTLKTSKAYHWN